jgi:hypothetical protein
MTRFRFALLPHVFLSSHRPAPPRPAYFTARDLRAAIAANAALIAFAGAEEARPDDELPAQFALGTPPDAAPDHSAAGRRDHAA